MYVQSLKGGFIDRAKCGGYGRWGWVGVGVGIRDGRALALGAGENLLSDSFLVPSCPGVYCSYSQNKWGHNALHYTLR